MFGQLYPGCKSRFVSDRRDEALCSQNRDLLELQCLWKEHLHPTLPSSAAPTPGCTAEGAMHQGRSTLSTNSSFLLAHLLLFTPLGTLLAAESPQTATQRWHKDSVPHFFPKGSIPSWCAPAFGIDPRQSRWCKYFQQGTEARGCLQ